MSSNVNMYNTQYLKSWRQNAEKEIYLTNQSVLESSYTMTDEAESSSFEEEPPKARKPEEGSWIDLNNYRLSASDNGSDSSTNTTCLQNWNAKDSRGNNHDDSPSFDGSLSTLLHDMSQPHHSHHHHARYDQKHRRRSSNTTSTSVTIIGGSSSKFPIRRSSEFQAEEYMIPEMYSSASPAPERGVVDGNRLRKKKDRKKGNDIKMTNVLFQITCLSIIIASFSFSLGFLFGAKNNRTSNLRYF